MYSISIVNNGNILKRMTSLTLNEGKEMIVKEFPGKKVYFHRDAFGYYASRYDSKWVTKSYALHGPNDHSEIAIIYKS